MSADLPPADIVNRPKRCDPETAAQLCDARNSTVEMVDVDVTCDVDGIPTGTTRRVRSGILTVRPKHLGYTAAELAPYGYREHRR